MEIPATSAPNLGHSLMTEDNRIKIALEEYKEVLTQFRALTDIRFKLLTYLPLGTVAAAIFVPATSALVTQPAISAFAFVVTLCIATYDKRNDQHYDELVARAAELERELQIEHGSFLHRPRSWLKYGFVLVGHRSPIGLIYAAAASLWAYLFTAPLVQYRLGLGWLKIAVPAVVIVCWRVVRLIEKARENKLRRAVGRLMTQLLDSNDAKLDDPQGNLVEAIKAQPILGTGKDKAKDKDKDKYKDTVERRVAYHWEKRDPRARAASALLSEVIDLPARWIEDVWSGRR